MLIKLILEYLQSVGYQKVESDITKRITLVNTTNNFVITHLNTGYTSIVCKDIADIRFKGSIENLQQLKLILRLIG